LGNRRGSFFAIRMGELERLGQAEPRLGVPDDLEDDSLDIVSLT
jgi:hypothetical protein